MIKTRLAGKRFETIAVLGSIVLFVGALALGTRDSDGTTWAQEAPAQKAEKPPEEAFKNVQLFKDLSRPQLLDAMQFIVTSLGVNCAHCHVSTGPGQFAWEKDDKKEKLTARKMITMTRDINKANFAGRPEVTCATCHQGRPEPRAIPPIPPLGAATETRPSPGPPGLPAQAVQLPAANDVLEKYVQALGGRPALEKFTTREIKGTLAGEMGRSNPLEIIEKAPNKYRAAATTPRGDLAQGFNGTVGWAKFGPFQRSLEGMEVARIARAAEFYPALDVKAHYPRLAIIGKEKIGDGEAYVLAARGAEMTEERLYFDVSSGLLVRRVVLTRTALGRLPEETDFADYRDVDGIKLPFTIQRMELNTRWTEKYSDVKQNATVDDARFDAPPPSPPPPPH